MLSSGYRDEVALRAVHKIKRAMRTGIGKLLLGCVLLGCATKGLRYTRLPMDPAWALVFVKGPGELRLDPAERAESQLVFQLAEDILLPRCSPDGTRVAFYRFTGRRGELDILPMHPTPDEAAEEREPLAEIGGLLGHRMMIFPPVWESGGYSLLVVAQDGLHRITTEGEHKRLVAHNDILGMSVSPDEKRIAYTDGTKVSVVSWAGEHIARLGTQSPANAEKQAAQPVAFSPDGRRIAFAAGRYLHIWDLESKEAREIQDMAETIFWIEWLPGGDRLLFTTGKTPKNIRSSQTEGHYALYSVKADGHALKFVFKDREMDPHLAQPTLSPDGRYVALVSAVDGKPRVMIVATDAAKATLLAEVGTTSHVSWLPVSGDLHAGAPVSLCRTVVFYPLE